MSKEYQTDLQKDITARFSQKLIDLPFSELNPTDGEEEIDFCDAEGEVEFEFEPTEDEQFKLRVACLDCLDFYFCWAVTMEQCEDWYDEMLDGDLDAYPKVSIKVAIESTDIFDRGCDDRLL